MPHFTHGTKVLKTSQNKSDIEFSLHAVPSFFPGLVDPEPHGFDPFLGHILPLSRFQHQWPALLDSIHFQIRSLWTNILTFSQRIIICNQVLRASMDNVDETP